MAKEMKSKGKHHHTEIHMGDNGGMKVSHFSEDEHGYPMETETNHYGPEESEEAMKDVRSMCCDDGGMEPASGKKVDREMMHKSRVAVGSHLASLGGKNKISKVS